MIQIDSKEDIVKVSGTNQDIHREIVFALAIYIRAMRRSDYTDGEIIDQVAAVATTALDIAGEEEVWENGEETTILLPTLGKDGEDGK